MASMTKIRTRVELDKDSVQKPSEGELIRRYGVFNKDSDDLLGYVGEHWTTTDGVATRELSVFDADGNELEAGATRARSVAILRAAASAS